VRWHPSDAVAYSAGITGVGGYPISLMANTTIDTVVQIYTGPFRVSYQPFDLPIFALDSNYAALLMDLRLTAAGIRGGVGVFGAYSYTIARIIPNLSP
jgi:hypothetical protein